MNNVADLLDEAILTAAVVTIKPTDGDPVTGILRPSRTDPEVLEVWEPDVVTIHRDDVEGVTFE